MTPFRSMLRFFALVVVASSSSPVLVVVAQAQDVVDPTSYFGGTNNQGYLDWIATSPMNTWNSTAFIASSSDPNAGAALHWTIDQAAQTIELALATQSTGWLGMGLSRTGGMLGTDIFVVEASNLTNVLDMHVLDARVPVLDECENWELLSANVTDDGFFLVRVQRLLDTEDPQDLTIHNDGDLSYPISFVIAAWGDEANHGYHGPNRARSGIRWFSTGESEVQLFADRMQAESASSFFVGASNYSVKLNETEYVHFCMSSGDMVAAGVDMENGVTVVGFDSFIDKSKHLHHFVLYASSQELNETSECGLQSMFEITYLWGPGEPPFAFPDNVGLPLGGNASGTYRTFVLQIHYDNADKIEDQLDSSGVNVHYTAEPREYQAGVYNVGDPFLYLKDQTIELGLSDHLFECSGSCSSLILADEQPVTVIREYLHMHQSGYAMYNDQIRNGEVVRTGGVDFFDFAQSGGPAVQQDPFLIYPGDSFRVSCYYNNDKENRTFGQGSAQEMCMAFLLYYPRRVIPISPDQSIPWYCGAGFADFGFEPCDAPYTTSVLNDGEVPKDRTFGKAASECPLEGSAGDGGDGGNTTTPGTSGGLMIAPYVWLLGTSGIAMLALF